VPDNTYRIVEIVGTSSEGVDTAIRNGIQRAGRTLRNVDWFQVTEIRGHLENGEVADWQVGIKVGFRIEDV
jgi:flavin-binding protein dodecin